MFSYGIVSSTPTEFLLNNGHSVQLVIPSGFKPSNASVVVVGAFLDTGQPAAEVASL